MGSRVADAAWAATHILLTALAVTTAIGLAVAAIAAIVSSGLWAIPTLLALVWLTLFLFALHFGVPSRG